MLLAADAPEDSSLIGGSAAAAAASPARGWSAVARGNGAGWSPEADLGSMSDLRSIQELIRQELEEGRGDDDEEDEEM